MEFADFEIRAWRKGADRVQVLVHRSPAGETAAPAEVRVSASRLKALAAIDEAFADFDGHTASLGEQLASILLPPAVSGLLDQSLTALPAGRGLRLRLSFDYELQRLGWELMYRRPPLRSRPVLDGFLVLDPRVSIVRGAPAAVERPRILIDRPRLLFAGALGSDGDDPLMVRPEHDGLVKALAPLADLILLEASIGTTGTVIEEALARPAAIFHYAGHTVIENEGAYLVKEFDFGRESDPATDRLYSGALARLLEQSSSQLAVFTACNSAHPNFIMPIARGGVPAIVSLHGEIDVSTAIAFSERLYGFLAVGLSLDEAMISARQYLLARGSVPARYCDWARPSVYMAAREPVLFPRADGSAEVQRQSQLAADRKTMNRRELRRAMVEAFSADDLRLLCADVEQSLREAGIAEGFSLDLVGAAGRGLEIQILEVINYVDRRRWLTHLRRAVTTARPELAALLSAA